VSTPDETVVVASDLDRTLIYSRAAFGLPDGDPTELVCVEHFEGAPLSYLTARSARIIADLAGAAVFVPTTTRTRAQLARVRVPGTAPRYAIAANGGFLLVDGRADADWSGHVRAALAANASPLAEVWAHLGRVCAPEFTLKLRNAEDLFVYAVVDREAVPAGFVAELTAWAAERGWSTSMQGRKLYLVPAALTKSAAVAEVARRVGAHRIVAAGDSLLDADLLAAATSGIHPAHGELFGTGWSAPHVVRTTAAGILAGEEIAGWLAAAVDAGASRPSGGPPARCGPILAGQ
jgi:hypothetical protein